MAFRWWQKIKTAIGGLIAKAIPRVAVGEVGSLFKSPVPLPRFLRDLTVGAFAAERQASFPMTRVFTHTQHDMQKIDIPLSQVSPLNNQQIHADGTLIGPDGQFIHVSLALPTGTMYDEKKFKSRLAAELKRMEEKGKVSHIEDASAYVKKAVMDFDFYLSTISARKPK